MTTEVAVLNRFGVALAADSAATVEHVHNNQTQRKVYNTANKLFTLSKFAPVGIVVYNAAALAGVPWETIIKSYRRQLGEARFPTLAEYSASFFNWIKSTGALFEPDIVKAVIFETCRLQLKDLSDKSQTAEELAARITKKVTSLEARPFVDGFDDSSVVQTRLEYGDTFKGAFDVAIPAEKRDESSEIASQYCSLLLVKAGDFSNYSGILICGFGDDEYVPHAVHYRTDIVVLGRPRLRLVSRYSISASDPSHVIPLADKEIIETLISGVSPSFASIISRGALGLILGIPLQLISQIDELSDERKAHYIAEAQKSLPVHFQTFTNGMTKQRDETYAEPIRRVIASLPVAELGTVAETLLSASQMHKKINPGVETVGGPVDVAVISKGDGFVWLRRKHYFDPRLNPTFVTKYFQD